MYQIIFVSAAKHKLSAEELSNIAKCTLQHSMELNITGRLLYRDGNYLGVLEGEDWAVKKRYEDACNNCLSFGSIIIDEAEIAERQFSDWHMDVLDKNTIRMFSDEQLKNDKNGSMHILNDFVGHMR